MSLCAKYISQSMGTYKSTREEYNDVQWIFMQGFSGTAGGVLGLATLQNGLINC